MASATPMPQGLQPHQGETLTDKAQSMASNVADQAREAGSFVADKAKAAVDAVSHGMTSVGHTVRDHTPEALTNAGAAIADRLETTGHYFEQKGLSGMGDDVADMIRANPVPAMLIGIGLGFCLARLLRS